MEETRESTVELVYFNGCPNADRARENLRAVLGEGAWTEWDLSAEDTPKPFRRHGSPTILVGGRDVTGAEGGNAAMACRADGAPSTDIIRRALADHG
ncbi:MAG: hypothetical protein RJQ04_07150 [Longimicrobiales bacterium]